jgi:hypothetical protein
MAAVATSWLGAVCGAFLALGVITAGQGLGAIFGGCRWIGLTLPIGHQPWALVNQPSLAFAGETRAVGYWLGGTIACLLVALLWVPLVPRPRGLTSELFAVQFSWMAAVVGLGWVALLDPWDGHLSRFLRLHHASPALVWIVPVLGAWAALIPTLRLLALARQGHPQLSRWGRLATIGVHLGLPTLGWIVTGILVVIRTNPSRPGSPFGGLSTPEMLWPPVLAAALPLLAAIMLAWLAFPRPWAHQPNPLSPKTTSLLLVTALCLIALQLVAGGPVPGGKARGVLWSPADSRNNVRSWVLPVMILGSGNPNGNR